MLMMTFLCVCTVETRIRANTQKRTTRGAGDKRGRRGKEKTVGNRHMRKSVEGRGMGQGTQGKQDGHYRDFQVLTQQGLSGRNAGNLEEVGLGWISGVEKIVVLDGER